MRLTINKNLYSRCSLLKAAYHFTDEYYVLLDQDDFNYYVDIIHKDGSEQDNIYGMFSNELVAQSTREAILEKTSSIRELILARAFASTIIDEKSETNILCSNDEESETDKGLFKDWYEE